MSGLAIEFSKIIKPYSKDRFLLAISGGMDSVALFYLFLHMKKNFGVQFACAHIHHGSSKGSQGQYRDQAQKFVEKLCRSHQVEFFTNPAAEVQVQGSENEWRQLRYAQLGKILADNDYKWIVLGHHAQDQMETRLMRLIRGTGDAGIEGMKLIERNRFRPLLNFQPKELKSYLAEVNGDWLEDPSNFVPDKFRNWIRGQWLPQLEAFKPGSVTSLGRSLALLAGNQDSRLPNCIEGNRLNLPDFYPLSRGDKQRVLAQFMNGLGLKNYGMSHINEVLKRLDSDQRELTFYLLRREWKLDAGHLKVLGPG